MLSSERKFGRSHIFTSLLTMLTRFNFVVPTPLRYAGEMQFSAPEAKSDNWSSNLVFGRWKQSSNYKRGHENASHSHNAVILKEWWNWFSVKDTALFLHEVTYPEIFGLEHEPFRPKCSHFHGIRMLWLYCDCKDFMVANLTTFRGF